MQTPHLCCVVEPGSDVWWFSTCVSLDLSTSSSMSLLLGFGDASSTGEPWWFLVDVMKLETGSVHESCCE